MLDLLQTDTKFKKTKLVISSFLRMIKNAKTSEYYIEKEKLIRKTFEKMGQCNFILLNCCC